MVPEYFIQNLEKYKNNGFNRSSIDVDPDVQH